MDAKLPYSVDKLLWDADKQSLDQEANKQVIIERVLNYGTLADWRWLVERYGIGDVRAVLDMRAATRRSAIRREAYGLASLILR